MSNSFADLDDELKRCLSDYQNFFVDLEFGRGFSIYKNRIKSIGINGFDSVLDAGGGIGNWAIPLGYVSKSVEVCDLSSERLLIGYIMAQKMGVSNVSFKRMSIEKLNYSDSAFDVVLCYSVLMFTNVDKTLAEFYRVLKPGGRLFLQVDLWRWYLGQGASQNGKRFKLLKIIVSRIIFGKPYLLTKSGILNRLKRAGFSVVSYGQDGETSFHQEPKAVDVSFYLKQPVGSEQLIEICAVK